MTHRHLRAFVSSRMGELAAERRAVAAALRDLYIQPFVYEDDAGARPDNARSTYLTEIDDADLYIALFWKGYGAYTIEEYERAWQRGKPCLIYERVAAERAADLQRFLDRIGAVGGRHTIARFDSADDLGTTVRSDIARWLAQAVRGRSNAPMQAPRLSPRHVSRPQVIAGLRARLFPPAPGAAPAARRAVVHGLAGSGKTALARELAYDPATAGAFPDGVLWVSLGKTPDLRQRLGDWGRALGDATVSAAGYPDALTGAAQLRTLLRDRACLLVVDDAWLGEHVAAFLVEGERCLLLVTTRRGDIAGEIGAERIAIPAMEESVALRVLAERAGDIGSGDLDSARQLVEAVGRLPLALDLIAAQVARHRSWTSVRTLWEKRRSTGLVRARGARGRGDNLLDSVALSLDDLGDTDREAYQQLGAFPEDVTFPVGAAATLWRTDELEAADLLAELADRALLLEYTDAAGSRYAFHDVLHDVVRDRLGEAGTVAAHAALVEGYRARCSGNWASGPDDGYFFEWITHHLFHAGMRDELAQLIGREWMDAQFRRTLTHRDFATDLGRLITAAAAEEPPRLAEEVRASILFAALGSLASGLPVETFALLGRLGQIERARALAALVQEPALRVDAYAASARGAAFAGRADEAGRLVASALESVLAQPADTSSAEALGALERLAPLAQETAMVEDWHGALEHTLARAEALGDADARTRQRIAIGSRLREAGATECAAALLGRDAHTASDDVGPASLAASPQARIIERAAAAAAAADSGDLATAEVAARAALADASAIGNRLERVVALTAAIPSLARAGPAVLRLTVAEADQALEMADDEALIYWVLAAPPEHSQLESALAMALGSHGLYDEAAARADRLPAQQRDALRMGLAAAAAHDGNFEMADRLTAGAPPKYRGFVDMSRAVRLAADGAVDRAFEVVASALLSPANRALAITRMAAACLDRGDGSTAADLAARAVAAAEAIDDVGPIVTALAAIAAAEDSAGRVDDSRETVRHATAIATAANSDAVTFRLVDIANSLYRQSRAAEADAVIAAMPNPADRLLCLIVGGGWLIRNGRPEEGRERADRAEALLASTDVPAKSMAWLAEVRARSGDVDAARSLIERHQALTAPVRAPASRADALLDIEPAFFRLGETEPALERAREAARLLIATAPADDPDVAPGTGPVVPWERRRAADALCRLGQHDEAIAFARTIDPPSDRVVVLLTVAEALVASEPDRAAEIAIEAEVALDLTADPPSAIPLLTHIGSLLVRAGRPDGIERIGRAEEAASCVHAGLGGEVRGTVVRAYQDAGQPERALAALRTGLAATRAERLDSTLDLVAAATPTLTDAAGDAVLQSVRDTLLDLYQWWCANPAQLPRGTPAAR